MKHNQTSFHDLALAARARKKRLEKESKDVESTFANLKLQVHQRLNEVGFYKNMILYMDAAPHRRQSTTICHHFFIDNSKLPFSYLGEGDYLRIGIKLKKDKIIVHQYGYGGMDHNFNIAFIPYDKLDDDKFFEELFKKREDTYNDLIKAFDDNLIKRKKLELERLQKNIRGNSCDN